MKAESVVSGEAFAANVAFKGFHATVQFDVLLQVVIAIGEKNVMTRL